jgi:hypothetical protein
MVNTAISNSRSVDLKTEFLIFLVKAIGADKMPTESTVVAVNHNHLRSPLVGVTDGVIR